MILGSLILRMGTGCHLWQRNITTYRTTGLPPGPDTVPWQSFNGEQAHSHHGGNTLSSYNRAKLIAWNKSK